MPNRNPADKKYPLKYINSRNGQVLETEDKMEIHDELLREALTMVREE